MLIFKLSQKTKHQIVSIECNNVCCLCTFQLSLHLTNQLISPSQLMSADLLTTQTSKQTGRSSGLVKPPPQAHESHVEHNTAYCGCIACSWCCSHAVSITIIQLILFLPTRNYSGIPGMHLARYNGRYQHLVNTFKAN